MNYGSNNFGGYGASKANFEDKFVKEFYRTIGNNAYSVRVVEINGNPYFGVCKFYKAPNGQFLPSRAQINVPIQALQLFGDALNELNVFVDHFYKNKGPEQAFATQVNYGPANGPAAMAGYGGSSACLNRGTWNGVLSSFYS